MSELRFSSCRVCHFGRSRNCSESWNVDDVCCIRDGIDRGDVDVDVGGLVVDGGVGDVGKIVSNFSEKNETTGMISAAAARWSKNFDIFYNFSFRGFFSNDLVSF